ncbi:peroxiredoxin-like family protein [Rhizobium sp. SYY.PMSO]|uniref:peroxiredoxin-like family protein n=1 Tax=Rhizobium sp. SYY.PMSO TaxID=3382192 RepID=UPI00398FFF09
MGLKQDLDAFKAQFAQSAPAGRVEFYATKIEELRQSFARDNAITEGDIAPDFSLSDAKGGSVSLSTLLVQGPTVITFYRGGWCPYCNIQLRAYQAILPQIIAAGASLVAISPQAPDGSLSTAEVNALTFNVLSDVGNRVAGSFGLVYSLADELRAALRSVNKALPDINGDDSWELPVPSTYVVARDGRVKLAHIDVDYTQRLEPEKILAALGSLRAI